MFAFLCLRLFFIPESYKKSVSVAGVGGVGGLEPGLLVGVGVVGLLLDPPPPGLFLLKLLLEVYSNRCAFVGSTGFGIISNLGIKKLKIGENTSGTQYFLQNEYW